MGDVMIQVGCLKSFPGNSLSLADISPLRNDFSFGGYAQEVLEDRLWVDFRPPASRIWLQFWKRPVLPHQGRHEGLRSALVPERACISLSSARAEVSTLFRLGPVNRRSQDFRVQHAGDSNVTGIFGLSGYLCRRIASKGGLPDDRKL